MSCLHAYFHLFMTCYMHFHQFINLFVSLLLLLLFLSHSTSPNILARNKVYLFTQNNDKIAIGLIKIWDKTVLFIESLCLGLAWRRMGFFLAISLWIWSQFHLKLVRLLFVFILCAKHQTKLSCRYSDCWPHSVWQQHCSLELNSYGNILW